MKTIEIYFIMSSYKKDINHIQLVNMRKIFVKSAKKIL